VIFCQLSVDSFCFFSFVGAMFSFLLVYVLVGQISQFASNNSLCGCVMLWNYKCYCLVLMVLCGFFDGTLR
jgi:hypothetical protein